MRLTENEFKEEYEVTVGVEFGAFLLQIDDKIIKLQIWDTAGQESFKSLNKIFYRGKFIPKTSRFPLRILDL